MGVVVVVGVTTAYHYDGWGNLIQQSSQGLITDFVLDERGDLPVVLGELRSNGSSTIYAYGPDGVAAQPTSRTDQIGQATRTTSYSYDGLERPTQVSNPEGAGGTAISYDANGRLIGDGARTYRYDARDRLVQVLGTGGADYRYNGDGALVGQTVGGTSTDYAQDVGAPLSEVLQARQGSTTTNYLYGTERFGALAGSTRTEELHDTLGSTRLTTDAAGSTQSALRFDPYGRPLSGTQPQPFGFTGEMQNGSSELVNLRARWYQPQLGVFVSKDPFAGNASQPASLHPYAYAQNSPARFTDPSGQCVGWLWGSGGCEFAGVNPANWNWQDLGRYGRGLAKPVVQGVQGAYSLIRDGRARYNALYQLARVLRDPHKTLPAIIWQGLTDPFKHAYYALVCDDSELLGQSVFELGSMVVGGAETATTWRAAWREWRSIASEGEALAGAARVADELPAGIRPGDVCSFTPDTLVATEGGEKAIGTLAVGDTVRAYNETTGSTGNYTVTAVLVHDDPVIEHLTIAGEQLTTTPEHPFFVQGRGWVAAGELREGDEVRKADSNSGAVEAVRFEAHLQEMVSSP